MYLYFSTSSRLSASSLYKSPSIGTFVDTLTLPRRPVLTDEKSAFDLLCPARGSRVDFSFFGGSRTAAS